VAATRSLSIVITLMRSTPSEAPFLVFLSRCPLATLVKVYPHWSSDAPRPHARHTQHAQYVALCPYVQHRRKFYLSLVGMGENSA
jgi:hypothetical protein